MTVVVFDNDVIHKLAALGLLDKAAQLLGTTERRVLATCRFKFKLNKPADARKKYGDAIVDGIDAFVKSAVDVTGVDLTGLDEAANAALGIDPGELQLLAFVAATPNAILVTGDKRALVALQTAPGCTDLVAKIAGRIVCFEQVLEQLLGDPGFTDLNERAAKVLHVDTVLRVLFTSSAMEPTVRDGLKSYLSDLRSKTGTLLRPES